MLEEHGHENNNAKVPSLRAMAASNEQRDKRDEPLGLGNAVCYFLTINSDISATFLPKNSC